MKKRSTCVTDAVLSKNGNWENRKFSRTFPRKPDRKTPFLGRIEAIFQCHSATGNFYNVFIGP
jgi:hypothetical protein